MNKVETHSFGCPVVSRSVLVKITKRSFTADQLPQPKLHAVEFTDCAYALQCPITKEVSPNYFVTEWESCAGAQSIKRNGRL
jgi:hypothetical protein